MKFKKNVLLKAIIIATFSLFVLSGIFILLHVGFVVASTGEEVIVSNAMFIISQLLYMVGLTVMQLPYFLRLKKRFNGTKYAVTRQSFIIFIILFIVQILSSISCLFSCILHSNNINSSALISYITFISTNIISSILVLHIFVQRIRILGREIFNDEIALKMIKMSVNPIPETAEDVNIPHVHTLDEVTVDEADSSKSKSLNSITSTTKRSSRKRPKKRRKTVKNKLLAKTARNTVCVFPALILSNLLSIFAVCRMFLVNNNQILWVLYLMLIILNQTINMFCIYLQRKDATKVYYICCSKQIKCIYIMFVGKKDNIGWNRKQTKNIDIINKYGDESINKTVGNTITESTETGTPSYILQKNKNEKLFIGAIDNGFTGLYAR